MTFLRDEAGLAIICIVILVTSFQIDETISVSLLMAGISNDPIGRGLPPSLPSLHLLHVSSPLSALKIAPDCIMMGGGGG